MERVLSKLDSVMGNNEWMEAYPLAEAHFMPKGLSDHSPMLVKVYPEISIGRCSFRYFKMWSKDPRFLEGVKACWEEEVNDTKMYRLMIRLKGVKRYMKQLNREGFSNIHIAEIKAKEKLKVCQQTMHDGIIGAANEEKSAGDEYRRIHDNYQSFLQQKAKLNWIRGGDDNTKIFHGAIREWKLRNTVYRINDVNGRWVDNAEGVQEAFLSYYICVLGASRSDTSPFYEEVIARGAVLTEEQ